MQTIRCDILICGGGLAGLSLLYRAMKSGIWLNAQIIVVDKSAKQENDKTWSFWKTADSDFDQLIHHQWKDLVFFSSQGERIPLKSGNYTYNSIKSIDFYQFVISYLQQFDNIRFVQEEITSIHSAQHECTLTTPHTTFKAKYLFNSVYKKPELRTGDQYFLQHFKGLRIRTSSALPAISEAYLMDFRTDQQHGTTFFYTLPMAENEVFVEYTLFSKSLLKKEEYDQQLKIYIADVLGIKAYELLEEEFGVIPMTNYAFKRFEGNIIHIGTAGGDTRASTGYTFTNLQKTISKILDSYQMDGHPFFKEETIGLKQQLYDATLLHVLAAEKYAGHRLFSDLFKQCPAGIIFAFLDAETSVFQDLHIMKSLRWVPFIKSFAYAVYKKLTVSKTS